MIVWYTPHALVQMRERNITETDVEGVLADPEVEETKREGRRGSWARVGDRALMVVHKLTEDGAATVVVTVYPQTRRPKA